MNVNVIDFGGLEWHQLLHLRLQEVELATRRRMAAPRQSVQTMPTGARRFASMQMALALHSTAVHTPHTDMLVGMLMLLLLLSHMCLFSQLPV